MAYPLSRLTPWLQPPPLFAFNVAGPHVFAPQAGTTQKKGRFALQKPAELGANMVGVQYVRTLLISLQVSAAHLLPFVSSQTCLSDGEHLILSSSL